MGSMRTLRKKSSQGLSLVEVMIAVFVVSVGVLSTSSVLWHSIRAERNSSRRSQAVYWGREMLNLVRSRNLPFQPTIPPVGTDLNDGDYDDPGDDNGPRRAFNAPPFASDFDDLNFERRIEMKLLSEDPNSHLNEVAAIKVTLFWNEGESDKQVTLWAYHRRP